MADPDLRVINNFATTLSAAIGSFDIVIDVNDASRIPSDVSPNAPVPLTLAPADVLNPSFSQLEVVYVEGIEGSSLSVSRGKEGTTPNAWDAGDKAEGRIPAAVLNTALKVASVEAMLYASSTVDPRGAWITSEPSGGGEGGQSTYGPRHPDAVVLGPYSSAYYMGGVSQGFGTVSKGYSAHAEGFYAQANSFAAHAEGYDTRANASGAHAEGEKTEATGVYSHAEGLNTKAVGDHSHAEGNNTAANANVSHVEGYRSYTTESAVYARAGGSYGPALQKWADVQGGGPIYGSAYGKNWAIRQPVSKYTYGDTATYIDPGITLVLGPAYSSAGSWASLKGRVAATDRSYAAFWTFECLAFAGGGSLSIVDSTITKDHYTGGNAGSWSLGLQINGYNLYLEATGYAGASLWWAGTVYGAQHSLIDLPSGPR